MNGVDAIEKAVRFGKCRCGKFKGIMMDCEMPIKNGFEAAAELTGQISTGEIKEIPIIACTAFTDDEQKNKCFENGMKGFLNKPVMLQELAKTLEDCGVTVH